MWSFYLQILIYAIEKWPFSGTYPLFYSDRCFFNMQIIIFDYIFGVPISRI